MRPGTPTSSSPASRSVVPLSSPRASSRRPCPPRRQSLTTCTTGFLAPPRASSCPWLSTPPVPPCPACRKAVAECQEVNKHLVVDDTRGRSCVLGSGYLNVRLEAQLYEPSRACVRLCSSEANAPTRVYGARGLFGATATKAACSAILICMSCL